MKKCKRGQPHQWHRFCVPVPDKASSFDRLGRRKVLSLEYTVCLRCGLTRGRDKLTPWLV